MSTSQELAHRLEAALAASGLTRQVLTERAGVSRQAVYRLLKGNDVQVSTLLAVMDVLQLDLATVPRGLKRGLPDLGGATGPVLAMDRGEPSPAPAHVMSAVQRRLAGLKQGGAAQKKGRS